MSQVPTLPLPIIELKPSYPYKEATALPCVLNMAVEFKLLDRSRV